MYTEASKRASIKYEKENLKRIPLNVQIPFYDRIKACADKNGESVNGFIKKAITERLDRDG